MEGMILEPYSVLLNFKMDSPMAAAQWGKMIAEFLETLARHCVEAGPCVIGHIKGFAGIPGNGFLKISVTSSDHPADVDAESPNDFSELSLTLNVLVYGHSKKMLAKLTSKTIDLSERPWSGSVAIESAEHGPIQINESSQS
jgi:hypothetical protein